MHNENFWLFFIFSEGVSLLRHVLHTFYKKNMIDTRKTRRVRKTWKTRKTSKTSDIWRLSIFFHQLYVILMVKLSDDFFKKNILINSAPFIWLYLWHCLSVFLWESLCVIDSVLCIISLIVACFDFDYFSPRRQSVHRTERIIIWLSPIANFLVNIMG